MEHVNSKYNNRLCILLLMAVAANAQTISIASSGDGSQLWLLTSSFLKSDPDAVAPGTRIFRYTPGGLELIARQEMQRVILLQPFLSSDGQTSGWKTFALPSPGGGFALPRTSLILNRKGKQINIEGKNTLALSRNGRWWYEGAFPAFYNPLLTDLDTGTSRPAVDLIPVDSRHAVSDAGVVVGAEPIVPGLLGNRKLISIWDGSAVRRLYSGDDEVTSVAISADGSTVLLATSTRVLRVDPASCDQQVLDEGAGPERFGMNSDASRIVIASGRAIKISGETLCTSPEDIADLNMTDDGSQIYFVTTANRVVKIDVDTREVSELFGPSPGSIAQSSYGTTPGSALRFQTAGFTEDMTFTARGVEFPFLKREAAEIQLQIPWDFPTGNTVFHAGSAASPFELRGTLTLETAPRPYIFTAFAEDAPVPAGSTAHLFLTGLGPLDRPLKTGEPGPTNPPASPLSPLACYLLQDTLAVGLRIPFKAYAPGLVGLYQVDAVVPETWPAGKSLIACTADNKLYTQANIWTR